MRGSITYNSKEEHMKRYVIIIAVLILLVPGVLLAQDAFTLMADLSV